MSEANDVARPEIEWVRTNFRAYLLLRLSDEEDERLHDALARLPALRLDLDEVEQELMDEWLDGQLGASDRADFERCYVEGPDYNRVKLITHRTLRLPEARVVSAPTASVIPIWPASQRFGTWAATVAVLLASVLALLWYRESRQNAQLRVELDRKSPPPVSAPSDGSRDVASQVEQPAGGSDGGGFMLPTSKSGHKFLVAIGPDRLVWGPVPDYRIQYRLRIRSESGKERLSPPLTPRDNAVEYDVPRPAQLALPWEVTVLGPGGLQTRPLARYTLAKQ